MLGPLVVIFPKLRIHTDDTLAKLILWPEGSLIQRHNERGSPGPAPHRTHPPPALTTKPRLPCTTLTHKLQPVHLPPPQVKSQIEFLIHQQDSLRARRDQLLRRIEQERRAPRADWQQDSFPWSARLRAALHDVFGLRDFR